MRMGSDAKEMYLGGAITMATCSLFGHVSNTWLNAGTVKPIQPVDLTTQAIQSTSGLKPLTKVSEFCQGRAFVAAAAVVAVTLQARGARKPNKIAVAAARAEAKAKAKKTSDPANKSAVDKTSDFVQKLFDFSDANQNNAINFIELQFAATLLEKCKITLSQKEIDAFFYRYCSTQISDWKRASLEWMSDALEKDVDSFWAENRLDVNHDFTMEEFNELLAQVKDKHSLSLSEQDLNAGWQDLHDNFFNKRSKDEFVNAVKASCMDSFDAILKKAEDTIGTELDGGKIRLAKQLMNSQHGFELSQEDILLFFRTHGRINRGNWFKGMVKLIEKDRQNNPKQMLISEVLLSDPELFKSTLENGIPRQMAYDFSQWSRAQSSDRYWKSILILMTQKSVLQRMGWPMTVCIMSALLVQASARVLQALGYPMITMPAEFFTLSSAPLGLLLVFRTNMSYARFDEARKIWGDSLNRCRDLMRQAAWIKEPRARANFMSLIPSFASSLKCLLRKPDRHDLAIEVGSHLSQREIRQMMTSNLPPPVWTLRQMGFLADKVHEESPMKHQLMSDNISELIANVGKCQRIFSTPMPATYTSLTTRFLLVWLILLPFMLYPKLKDAVVFAQILMAFFLLGIEDLGIQIEEPFSVLPLSRIVRSITNEAAAYSNEHRELREAPKRVESTVKPPESVKPSSSDNVQKILVNA